MILGLEDIIVFLLLGGIVGFIAGLFGVGGGGIFVPAFTTIFLLNDIETVKVVHLALGTSMASIIGTSLASLNAHNKNGTVRWDIFKTLTIGVITGTFLATFISSYLSSFILAVFFTCFMAYVSLQMFLDKKPKSNRNLPSNGKQFGAGSIIGAVSAMVSIGGGAMTVPYLLWHNIDIKKAIGTSAAIGFPIAVSGSLGFMVNGWHETNLSSLQIGYVYIPAVIIVTLTGFFTAPLGVKFADKLPVKVLKKLFGLLLLGLSIKMLFLVI